MSRGRRWKPPHPDREQQAVARTERRHFEDESRVRDAKPRHACTWRGCTEMADASLDIPLCISHAFNAHTAYQAILDAKAARKAEIEEERHQNRIARKEALAVSTAKLDAGLPLEPSDPEPGWIYYLRNDGIIKIGYTADIFRRTQSYPPNAQLLAVEPGTKKLERARHSLFHAHLAWGREWFHEAPELTAWIASVVEKFGEPTDLGYTFTTPGKAPIVGGKHSSRRW